MKQKNEKNMMDNALRRLGGILASPSLILSYGHTTPRMERAWLRRLGLSKEEIEAFLDALCCHGLMDEGAEAVVYDLCRRKGLTPEVAARLLLQGEGWPEEPESELTEP